MRSRKKAIWKTIKHSGGRNYLEEKGVTY